MSWDHSESTAISGAGGVKLAERGGRNGKKTHLLRDSPPVNRLRREMGAVTLNDQVAVPSFRIGVLLLHEGDAGKTIL